MTSTPGNPPDSRRMHQPMNGPSKPNGISRRALLAGAMSVIAVAIPPSAVRAATPEDYVRNLAKQVMNLARSGQSDAALKRRFLALLTRSANMNAIARFALGKYLRKMPKSMQSEYYRLVLDYIAGLFVYYRKDLAGKDVRVRKTVRRGKWVTVSTDLIYPDGRTSPVKWRVYAGGGRYRVGDVNIQGIWLSLRMRDKFVSILNRNRGDFNALLKYLRDNAV